MMTITMVRPNTSWAFPESSAADNSESEHSSNGVLSRKVHLDNGNHFAAVLLRKTQRPSPPWAPPFLPAMTELIVLSCANH